MLSSAFVRVVHKHAIFWINSGLLILFLAFPAYGSVSETITLITISAALLTLISVLRGNDVHFPAFLIVIGIYVLYMWALVPISPLPASSLGRVWTLFPILLIFLAFVNFVRKSDLKIWEDSIIVFIVILCLIETGLGFFWLAKWFGISENGFSLPPIGYRIQGILLAGSNFTSVFLNLALPFIVLRLMMAKSKRAKWLWTLVSLLIVIIQYFSSSRGGWIGSVAAVSVTVILYCLRSGRIVPSDQLGRQLVESIRKNLGILPLLSFFVFVVIAFFNYQTQISPGHYGLLSGREQIWARSLQIWSNSIYLGHGAGSFPILYAHLSKLPPGWLAADAHNLWLEVAAENGLLGIFFALLIGVMLARLGIRVWKSAKDNPDVRARWAAYVGVGVGIFVSNLSGFYFQIPIYTITCLLLLSLAMKLDEDQTIKLSRASGASFLILILFLFGYGSWFLLRGVDSYRKGADEILSGNESAGMKLICDSARQAPEKSVYQYQCGLAAAQVYYETVDENTLDRALQATRTGLAMDPYWPVNRANLSILEWLDGERTSALADMKDAVQKAPGNALLAVNLGWMAEELGLEDLARASYRQAILVDPWLSMNPFFKESQLRYSAAQYGILADNYTNIRIAAFLAIRNSDFKAASRYLRHLLSANPTDPEATTLQALLAQKTRDGNALFLAQKSIFLDDSNPRNLVWAAQVARSAGKDQLAISFIQQAFVIWDTKRQYDTDTYYYSIWSAKQQYYRGQTVFNPLPFATSYIPGYIRADLSEEMREAFLWLADHYRSEGEYDKEKAILTGLHAEEVLEAE